MCVAKRLALATLMAHLVFTVGAPRVFAASGIIDSAHKYAWGNTGGWVNFAPTHSTITVTDSELTGYAWSANNGWINLAPAQGGVKNDGGGTLSGFAWDPVAGWVNFSGVTIDATGHFHGQATGANAYIINFDCASCDVMTTWSHTSSSGDVPTIPPVVVPPPPVVEPPPGVTEPPTAVEPPTVVGDGAPSNTSSGTSHPPLPPTTLPVPGDRALGSYIYEMLPAEFRVVAEAVASPAAVVGVISGIAPGAIVVFSSVSSAPDLLLSIIRLWDLLLVWLGIRKRKPWGTVYDSVTKQPLDPAYVVLRDASGNEVKTSITDLNGRYGFLTGSGSYQIEANKTHYQFPSQRLAGHVGDELYQNLYFGGALSITEGGDVITRNIPMDPIGFDWNEFIKNERKLLRYYSNRARIFAFISLWLFRIGFVAAVYACSVTRSTFDIVVLALYVGILILRYLGFGPRSYGSLIEKATGVPLSFALVRVRYANLEGEVLRSCAADKIGRYYALVPNGQYVVDVLKKNDDESYATIYTSPVLDIRNGIINSNFAV